MRGAEGVLRSAPLRTPCRMKSLSRAAIGGLVERPRRCSSAQTVTAVAIENSEAWTHGEVHTVLGQNVTKVLLLAGTSLKT